MSCRDNKCYDNECGYIDLIHFQHRSRHYENGNVSLTWCHHPMPYGLSNVPFSNGVGGQQTNFIEFTGHGQPTLEDVNGLKWEQVSWCIGQHPIGFMDEMLEELNITLTPEEDALLNDCDLLLYYVADQVWKHNIVPFQRPSPRISCVLTDAGKGRLVRVLWSKDLYPTGYEWNRALRAVSCDEHGIYTDRDCVWRESSGSDHNHLQDHINVPGYVNFGRAYPLHSMKPTRDRVVLLGPASGKCDFSGPGGSLNINSPVAFGHIVQVRNTFTGELLFDGGVESEVATTHFTFEGSEVTCGSDPWCEPFAPEQEPPAEEEGYVPTGVHWAYAFDDTALLACMSVYGNRADLEAYEDESENTFYPHPTPGGLRLVTLHQSETNEHMLQESNRSPLGFVPFGGLPTYSPDGLLWVSAFRHAWNLPKDDPDYFIEYGIWKVGMGSVSDPAKEEEFADQIGTLDVWCDELYCLASGYYRYDPETDTSEPYFYTKRTPQYGGEVDDLSAQFAFNVGFYGWEWGFWGAGYFQWDDNLWDHQGWSYFGWSWGDSIGCAGGNICTNYFYGPVTWTSYVVADWTEGGDLDKINTKVDPLTKQVQVTNPCRDICHDSDLEEDDDGCGGCNCAAVELEVEFGEPDCCCNIPVTVNCVGCGSRNYPAPNRHTFDWATKGLAWVDGCACVQAGLTKWEEGVCGTTFFVPAGAEAILLRYSRCGCAWNCCYPIPACSVEGDIQVSLIRGCNVPGDVGDCSYVYVGGCGDPSPPRAPNELCGDDCTATCGVYLIRVYKPAGCTTDDFELQADVSGTAEWCVEPHVVDETDDYVDYEAIIQACCCVFCSPQPDAKLIVRRVSADCSYEEEFNMCGFF